MELKIGTKDCGETRKVGRTLAFTLEPGAVVALVGELGSGKTEFVKGMAGALGLEENGVTSPTFTIINEYPTRPPLYHFDLYRLENPHQLDDIGAEEYLWGDGICAVEWADLFPFTMPADTITVRIVVTERNLREIHISSPLNNALQEQKISQALQQ